MTIREIQWRIEAYVQERNRHLELLAQLASWVTSPFVSKPVRVKDLISRPGLQSKEMDWEKW